MIQALRVENSFPPYMMDARDVDPTGTHIVPPRARVVEAATSAAPPAVATARRGLVLAGGAAKGAFEVGALSELAAHGIRFRSIVGTSAGALNGAYFAAGVRAGREHDAAQALVQFWEQDARWRTILDVSPREILAGRGLSTSARLEHVFRQRIETLARLPARHPVQLRMVTTRLQPAIEGDEKGRYEHVFSFTQNDFASRIDEITRAAVASAAFPGVFAPVEVPGIGDCVDGGFVANTPMTDGATADEIYVLAPWAAAPDTTELSGLSLVNQWIEILVSERFHRELSVAQQHPTRSSSGRRRSAVKRAPRIILVRPEQQLPGGLLAAFGDDGLRREYIARGRVAARLALSQEERYEH